MVLKYFSTIFVSLLFAGAVQAAPTKTYNYKANWVQSKKVSHQSGNAIVEMQTFQRMVRLGNNIFPAATLTTGEIKSTTEEGFPKDMSKAVSELTGIQNWKKEVRGNYTAYEAPIPGQARLMKLFISKQKGVYKYSIATVRVPYMFPTYFEAELIQREQIGDLKGVASLLQPSSTNAYAKIYQLLVSPAEAAGSDILGYLQSWLGGASTGLNNGVAAVNNGVATGTAAINNGAAAVNNGANAINNGANALDRASGSLDNASNVVTSAQGTLDKNTALITHTVDTNVDKVNTTANKINDTMKGFQDPVKMGKVAAATGFGAALGYGAGALLFQFAVDGSVKLARKVFYAITGNLPPEVKAQLSAEGGKAWDDLEKYSDQVMNMENDLAKNLLAINELTGENPVTAFADIDPKIRQYQDRLAEVQKALASGIDNGTKMACTQEAFTLQQQIKTLEDMKPVLASQSAADLRRNACEKLQRLYQQWSVLEMNIYNARGVLLENVSALMDSAQAQANAATERKISDRENTNTCKKSVEDRMDTVNDDLSKNGCVCDARVLSGTCKDICRTKELTKGYLQDCLDMAEMRKGINPTKERLRQAELLKQYSAMMKDSYAGLVNAYCDPGETGSGCTGEAGSFGRIKNQLAGLFAQADKQCGAGNGVRMATAADIKAGSDKAASLGDQPIASSSNLPKPAESGGFLSRIGAWFKGLFS